MAKRLTKRQWQNAFRDYTDGVATQDEIARRYKINRSTVYRKFKNMAAEQGVSLEVKKQTEPVAKKAQVKSQLTKLDEIETDIAENYEPEQDVGAVHWRLQQLGYSPDSIKKLIYEQQKSDEENLKYARTLKRLLLNQWAPKKDAETNRKVFDPDLNLVKALKQTIDGFKEAVTLERQILQMGDKRANIVSVQHQLTVIEERLRIQKDFKELGKAGDGKEKNNIVELAKHIRKVHKIEDDNTPKDDIFEKIKARDEREAQG